MPTNSSPTSNGNHLSKRTQHVQEEIASDLMPLPPWLQSLRDSMQGAIQGSDLTEIMAAQVEKAKGGCMKAASFVFNQAHKMMQAEKKNVTIVQNNYYGGADAERPDTPDAGKAGTTNRIKKMAARAAAKLPLNDPNDGPRPVTDEEEKEMRRREAEEREE